MEFDNQLVRFMERLAFEAGNIARHYWRTPYTVEQKDDASPVTIADKEIERCLRELIVEQYPDHGIIGEEHGSHNAGAVYQWVIDPIDGTKSFIAGFHSFTTLIALCKGGVPLYGCITQPVTGETWIGRPGQPSILNGMEARTRAIASFDAATLTTTSMFHFSPAQMAGFQALRQAVANTILGYDAYSYAMLASGHADLVIDVAMKPYDYCALAPVITGAGGTITDWRGNPLTLDSDGTVLAAANPKFHEQALKLLAKAAL